MFLPIHAARQYSARFMGTFFLALLLRTPYFATALSRASRMRHRPCFDARWSLGLLVSAADLLIDALAGNTRARCAVHLTSKQEVIMGRGILLWLLGVPIPIIILLFLFFR